MTGWRIVCDVGGTNVRYARCAADRSLSDVVARPLSDSPDCGVALLDDLRAYRDRFPDGAMLNDAVIAAAGPIDQGVVRLTNRDQVISADATSRVLGGVPVSLLNDLEAVALSLPWLPETGLRPIFAPLAPLRGPRLVVNIGTGFGGALLFATAAGWHAVACEPGHMTCPAPAEPAIDMSSRRMFMSVEDMLSGAALRTPQTIARKWNLALPAGFPDDATDLLAHYASAPDGAKFIRLFSALLGRICGDLVLACGAWGGVHLSGSVASAWFRHGDLEEFLAAFIDKGPMAARMSRVELHQIIEPFPALIGLCHVRSAAVSGSSTPSDQNMRSS